MPRTIRRTGFALMGLVAAAAVAASVALGAFWSLKSVLPPEGMDAAVWNDLGRTADAIRLFAAEKRYPPKSSAELVSAGYLAPSRGTGVSYVWTLEYGKVRVFAGTKDAATGAEKYAHDSEGNPFVISVEYDSPEPTVFLKGGENKAAEQKKVHAFSEDGRYLYSFVTEAVGDSGGGCGIAWNPKKDVLAMTSSSGDVYEYTPMGAFVSKRPTGLVLKNHSMLATDNDGRYYVASYGATAGSKGLVCFDENMNELWYKTVSSVKTDILANASLTYTATWITASPIIVESPSLPNGGVLTAITVAGQPTTVFALGPDGTRRRTMTSAAVSAGTGSFCALQDGTFLTAGWANYAGIRHASDGTALTGASNTLVLTEDGKNLNIYNVSYGYGKVYVLDRRSRGDLNNRNSRLHTFKWNADLGAAKQDYVVDGEGIVWDAISMAVRRSSGAWVSENVSPSENYLRKIGSNGGVEKKLRVESLGLPAGNNQMSRAAFRSGDMFWSLPHLYGIARVSESGTLLKHFGTRKYLGVAFDAKGRLWAHEFKGDATAVCDVWDVSGDEPKLVFSIQTGIGNGELSKDPSGNMWVYTYSVVNASMFPKIFDTEGNFIRTEKFDFVSNTLSSITFDGRGNIFLCSPVSSTLRKYDAFGRRLKTVTGVGNYISLAVDNLGRIWASAHSDKKLDLYTADMEFLSSFPLGGLGLGVFCPSFSSPAPEVFGVSESDMSALDVSLAPSWSNSVYGTSPGELRKASGAASAGNLLFVADAWNKRISVYSKDGSYAREFGGSDLTSPGDLDVDALAGRAFVLDGNKLEVFGADGKYLGTVAGGTVPNGTPSGNYLFDAPRGVGYLAKRGYSSRIAVADTGNNRVQVFDGLGWFLRSVPAVAPVDAAFSDSGDVYVLTATSVGVYDSGGVFKFSFGSAGTTDGKFDGAERIAVSGDSVYVADKTRIQRFEINGNFVGKRTADATGGLAASRAVMPYVYVADGTRHKVLAYDAFGNYADEWGEPGTGPGQLDAPRSVAVDGEGNVYVADSSSYIKKFSVDGTFLFRFGGPGVFFGISDMLVFRETLYVADGAGNTVSAYDLAGNFEKTLGTGGTLPGEFSSPGGIAVDPLDSKVWVADTGNHRAQQFDGNGNFAVVAGVRGSGTPPAGETPEFESPSGIAVVGDSLVVLDSGNRRFLELTSDYGNMKATLHDDLPATGLGKCAPAVDGRIYAPWNDRVAVVEKTGDVSYIGEAGSGRGRLAAPVSAALVPMYRERVPGKIFIAGSDMKIRAYDEDMNFLYSFGGKSYGVGELTYPYDIVKNPSSGNIHVLNAQSPYRVYTFSPGGVLLNTTTGFGGALHLVVRGSDVYAALQANSFLGSHTPSARGTSHYKLDGLGNIIQSYSYKDSGFFTDSEGRTWTHRTNVYGVDTPAFSRWNSNDTLHSNVFLGGSMTHAQQLQSNRVPAAGYGTTNQSSTQNTIYVNGDVVYVDSYSYTAAFNLSGTLLRNYNSIQRSTVKFDGTKVYLMRNGSPSMIVLDKNLILQWSANFANLPLVYKTSGTTSTNGWVDSSNVVHIANRNTKKAFSFASGAAAPSAEYGYLNTSAANFSSISSITADEDGLYVLDFGLQNLKKFDFFGNLVWKTGDEQGESNWANPGGYEQIDVCGSNVYVPSFYNFGIRTIDKNSGAQVSFQTWNAYNYQTSVAALGAGKFASGLYYLINTANDGLYYKGSATGTAFVKGPSSNATGSGYFESLPGLYPNRMNMVFRLPCGFALSTNGGFLWLFDKNDNFLGRKSGFPGYWSIRRVRYIPEKDEVVVAVQGSSELYFYDYTNFLSSSTPTNKKIIDVGFPVQGIAVAAPTNP